MVLELPLMPWMSAHVCHTPYACWATCWKIHCFYFSVPCEHKNSSRVWIAMTKAQVGMSKVQVSTSKVWAGTSRYKGMSGIFFRKFQQIILQQVRFECPHHSSCIHIRGKYHLKVPTTSHQTVGAKIQKQSLGWLSKPPTMSSVSRVWSFT